MKRELDTYLPGDAAETDELFEGMTLDELDHLWVPMVVELWLDPAHRDMVSARLLSRLLTRVRERYRQAFESSLTDFRAAAPKSKRVHAVARSWATRLGSLRRPKGPRAVLRQSMSEPIPGGPKEKRRHDRDSVPIPGWLRAELGSR